MRPSRPGSPPLAGPDLRAARANVCRQKLRRDARLAAVGEAAHEYDAELIARLKSEMGRGGRVDMSGMVARTQQTAREIGELLQQPAD